MPRFAQDLNLYAFNHALGQMHVVSYALQNAFPYERFRLGPRE